MRRSADLEMKTVLNKYWFYAAVTILCWGVGNVLTRVALWDFSPFSVGFLRYLLASAILLGIVFIKKLNPPKRELLPWFILSGFCGFSFYMVAYNIGYMTVTAATGSAVSAVIPPMTALVARFCRGEKLWTRPGAARSLHGGGLLYIAFSGGAMAINRGVVWMVISAVSLAIYNFLQRKLSQSCPQLQCSIYSIFFGMVMLTPFSPKAFAEVGRACTESVLSVLFLGVFSSAVGFLCWTKAFSLADNASQVSNFMFFTPLVSAAVEIVLLKDIPSHSVIVGGAVILVGALIFNLAAKMHYSHGESAISK